MAEIKTLIRLKELAILLGDSPDPDSLPGAEYYDLVPIPLYTALIQRDKLVWSVSDERISLEKTKSALVLGLATLDSGTQHLALNRTLANFYGKSVSDCLGSSLQMLHPELAEALGPVFKEILETKDFVEDETVVTVDSEGETYTWLYSISPIINQGAQKVIGFVLALGLIKSH